MNEPRVEDSIHRRILSSIAAHSSICTMRATHIPLQRSTEFSSLAVSSRNCCTYYPPGSEARPSSNISWKASKLSSPPWSEPLSINRGRERQFAQLEQKNKGFSSRCCLEFSGGVISSSCGSSSRNGNYPSASHVVGRGNCPARTHGFAGRSCELVLLAACTSKNGLNMVKARDWRHRRKRVTRRGISIDRQFSYGVVEATYEGWHPSFSENKVSTEEQILAQTLTQNSGRAKAQGLKPVPCVVNFTTCIQRSRSSRHICCCASDDSNETKLADPVSADRSVDNVGVQMALALLRFYKGEISPYIPASCRYVPTCSEYSQQAYKKYGFVKGSILTAWRLARCNPLGSSGFDPPRWFGEERPPQV